MKKQTVGKWILPLVFLLTINIQSARGGEPTELTKTFIFGVVPQQAPGKLLRSWSPVLQSLQEETGYRFKFQTAPDIPTFEQRLADGVYDFAYMNPYHFTVFNAGNEGYQALAKAKDKRIKGILVVRKDSPIQSLHDLDGQALAYPAPAAFAATLLTRAQLKNIGIDTQARFVASHDSVYKNVAGGFYPAGGGVIRTLKATDPAVNTALRVLWQSPGYTPHAIAYHPRLNELTVQRVLSALVALDSKMPAVLEGLKVKGFEPAQNADWDDVRALNITTEVGVE